MNNPTFIALPIKIFPKNGKVPKDIKNVLTTTLLVAKFRKFLFKEVKIKLEYLYCYEEHGVLHEFFTGRRVGMFLLKEKVELFNINGKGLSRKKWEDTGLITLDYLPDCPISTKGYHSDRYSVLTEDNYNKSIEKLKKDYFRETTNCINEFLDEQTSVSKREYQKNRIINNVRH